MNNDKHLGCFLAILMFIAFILLYLFVGLLISKLVVFIGSGFGYDLTSKYWHIFASWLVLTIFFGGIKVRYGK